MPKIFNAGTEGRLMAPFISEQSKFSLLRIDYKVVLVRSDL